MNRPIDVCLVRQLILLQLEPLPLANSPTDMNIYRIDGQCTDSDSLLDSKILHRSAHLEIGDLHSHTGTLELK